MHVFAVVLTAQRKAGQCRGGARRIIPFTLILAVFVFAFRVAVALVVSAVAADSALSAQ